MPKHILLKSTSGIRGLVGRGLDAQLVTTYGAAFGTFLRQGKVIVGRDSRPSGKMFSHAVTAGLLSVGINVVDLGIVPTPTVEIAVKDLKAAGGICVTASHNPSEWNALKFFSSTGEFITAAQYKRLNNIFESGQFSIKPHDKIGRLTQDDGWIERHIRQTLAIKLLAKRAIKKAKFTVVVDAINGAGSTALPDLLERMGAKVIRINCKGDGDFVHEPEPKPSNLQQLGGAVRKQSADLGMACDPDADRLALVNEHGEPISEELTLTIAVHEVLSQQLGDTVVNLSTSRMTADVARALGSKVHYAKVGEANVVAVMRRTKAIIGGEGNGGVIYPSFHAGRDSLVAAAFVLSALARCRLSLAQLVETFPVYYTIKSKAAVPGGFDRKLTQFERLAGGLLGKTKIDRRDGLRFDFDQGWLQLRKSNTEPIYRVIVETDSEQMSRKILRQVKALFSGK